MPSPLFCFKDKWSLLRAYLVYVRPILEYNSVIGLLSPHLKQDMLSIEKIERRFTKRLWKLNTVSYPERLHHLCIPSLDLRRLCWLNILLQNCFCPSTCQIWGFFFTPSTSSRTRGHPYKLFKSHCCTATCRNFFHRKSNKCAESVTQHGEFFIFGVF